MVFESASERLGWLPFFWFLTDAQELTSIKKGTIKKPIVLNFVILFNF